MLCPKCKVDWTELEDSLKHPEEPDNYINAVMIIENCQMCKAYFSRR